ADINRKKLSKLNQDTRGKIAIGIVKKAVSILEKSQVSVPDSAKGPIKSVHHLLNNWDAKSLDEIFGEIFSTLPSIARELNKFTPLVEINVEGFLIFKHATFWVQDVMTHIIRNSIDHGIETPEERARNGKQEIGLIKVKADVVEEKLVVEIHDDGRGLNMKKIRELVFNKKPDLKGADLNDMAIAQNIFCSGFTTSENITSISGRGVGLDIAYMSLMEHGSTIDLIFDDKSREGDDFRMFTLKIMLPKNLYMDIREAEYEDGFKEMSGAA
ncbi:MAG: hypothetical protein HQK54_18060, partial [Oligoflexales bacterium]|nr:hypothetical protein [Oligoflexales bacterium]